MNAFMNFVKKFLIKKRIKGGVRVFEVVKTLLLFILELVTRF